MRSRLLYPVRTSSRSYDKMTTHRKFGNFLISPSFIFVHLPPNTVTMTMLCWISYRECLMWFLLPSSFRLKKISILLIVPPIAYSRSQYMRWIVLWFFGNIVRWERNIFTTTSPNSSIIHMLNQLSRQNVNIEVNIDREWWICRQVWKFPADFHCWEPFVWWMEFLRNIILSPKVSILSPPPPSTPH